MPMTLEEYRRRFPDRPEPIPLEYLGKWIAWDSEHREIVASSDELSEVSRQAEERGHEHPVYQFVPRSPFYGYQSLRHHSKAAP